ncbi:hypothetical protein [uncultured Chryseobacterium sp.]|uniref:hypothetical protein n=1 Tax=uncultured Chryseobacterium sp. TaxID=259322 RepID=UPI0025F0308A|nr:hypothetical protein [uncultured Chryseobacterium sp.]
MKLLFKTSNPSNLKNEIIKKIENNELDTWSIRTRDKKYLKHTGQWGEKGEIELTTDNITNTLSVKFLKSSDIQGDIKKVEGHYLGRFCQIIFVNFPHECSSITIQ